MEVVGVEITESCLQQCDRIDDALGSNVYVKITTSDGNVTVINAEFLRRSLTDSAKIIQTEQKGTMHFDEKATTQLFTLLEKEPPEWTYKPKSILKVSKPVVPDIKVTGCITVGADGKPTRTQKRKAAWPDHTKGYEKKKAKHKN
jgi:hypothetical protein